MPSYLNNFVGYFLNFFKQDNGVPTACSSPSKRNDRNSVNDPTARSTPPRRNDRNSANDPTARSSPPRRNDRNSANDPTASYTPPWRNDRNSANDPTASFTPPWRNDRNSANDPTARSSPPRRNDRNRANDPTACSTPPRRSNSVIENRRLKEDITKQNAKQRGFWTHCPHVGCCSNNFLHNPAPYGNFLDQNEGDIKHAHDRGDGLDFPRDCCINRDDAVLKDMEYPSPPCKRRQQQPLCFEQPSYGLRRSLSLESCYPTEDRMRVSNRKTLQMHHILGPIDRVPVQLKKVCESDSSEIGIGDMNPKTIEYRTGGMRLSLDSDKDYPPLKLIHLTPPKQSESSSESQKVVVEDHKPKPSRIPVYKKKHLPAKVSKSLPQQLERTESKEPACLCYRELLARPLPKGWRAGGHAYYCPKSVVAYRSYLTTKLENLFRVISKKKYCGNIIDAASHSRWMKLADAGVDENALGFRKYAKGRVVLSVSEYKMALKNICSERKLDYWDLVKTMTEIELLSPGSNSSVNGWKGSSN